MKTDFETLKALSTYIINNLTQAEMLAFDVENRAELSEKLATELNVGLATDEDIKTQAIEEVEDNYDFVEGDITESDIYTHARKEIIKSFNGEAVSGLYLVESLNQVANRVKNFILESDLVEDVYGTDEKIVEFLVEKIRSFSIKRG